MMYAAVVHAAPEVPRYEPFAEPALVAGEVVGRVLAAGLHQLVRVRARGEHYTSTQVYPQVPGVDGVAALPDGRRVYCGWLRPPYGTFAERAAIDPARALPIPDGMDPVRVAGMVNPASSSWYALKLRARLQPGETVMVLGATGASGSLAVQVAKQLGAGRVIAVGRSRDKLAALPADAALTLDEAPGSVEDVDIVLDYLWGAPAMAVMAAKRGPRRLRFVNIGQSAGRAEFTPHYVRGANTELVGSGFGSVTPADMAAELPALIAALPGLTLPLVSVPLADVAAQWPRDDARLVFVP